MAPAPLQRFSAAIGPRKGYGPHRLGNYEERRTNDRELRLRTRIGPRSVPAWVSRTILEPTALPGTASLLVVGKCRKNPSQGRLFPLNGAGGFAGNVQHDSINPFHFVRDPAADSFQEVVG